MTRNGGLLDILQALHRQWAPITAAALAEEHGVALRTFKRDMAAMLDRGSVRA